MSLIKQIEGNKVDNITFSLIENKLVIEVEMDKRYEAPSASGRSVVVGSTHGFASVNGEIAVNMNVIRKNK